MKRLIYVLIAVLATLTLAHATQISIPYVFTPNSRIMSEQFNQNFSVIATGHNDTDNGLTAHKNVFKDYTSGRSTNEVNALKFGDDISAALSHPSTAGKVVVVSVPMTCNSDTTRPADRQIKIENGGNIDPDFGKTFNWNGGKPVGDPVYQIHGGAGTVTGLIEARPEWWAENAVPGTTDMSAAFGSAVTAVTAAKGVVRLSATKYGIGSTVTAARLKVVGVGDGSILKPLMTDGTPVIDITAGTTFFSLEDFRIDSELNQADFLTGAMGGQNCTGIRINASGGSYAARYHVKNVIVRGVKLGWDIKGFVGSLENVWALNCETGLRGTTMNSTRINLRAENCRKDLEITASNGIHFDQYITQGGAHQSGLVTSTIDGVNGIRFTAPYFEQSRNMPFITFGGTTACTGVALSNVSLAVADNASNDYNTYPLAFDQVDGLYVDGYFSTGSHHNIYSTTTNTKNIVDNSRPSSGNVWGPHDASKNLGVVRNLFPNPNFDLWFRGWPSVAFTRCAGSLETTIVRRGANALKLTATAGQTNNYVQFVLNDTFFVTPLRGKTLTLYVWVWIPNDAVFDANALGSQPFQPVVSLASTNATPATTTTASVGHHTVRNAWNLMKVTHTIQSDATRIDVNVYMNNGGVTAAGTEFVVIDSIYLVEGNGGQDVSIRNGWIDDSAINPVRGLGGKLVQRVTSIPNDADMTYEVGDRFELAAPAAGGSIGSVVTTAGTGATMVTKTYGAVAP